MDTCPVRCPSPRGRVSTPARPRPRSGCSPAGLEELRAVGHEALTVRTVAQRAGVSPATAYTYLASKNHLFAELFWRFLAEDAGATPTGATPLERVQSVTRHLAERLAGAPELAAAVTPALLGTDPDVERLRLRIGAEFVDRFRAALGDDADPASLETLALALLRRAAPGRHGPDDLRPRSATGSTPSSP